MSEDQETTRPDEDPTQPEASAPEEQPSGPATEDQPSATEEQPSEPAAEDQPAAAQAEEPPSDPAAETQAEAPSERPEGEPVPAEAEAAGAEEAADAPGAEEVAASGSEEAGDVAAVAVAAEADEPEQTEEPAAPTLIELSADARYIATGKRKSSVARVILRPGDGSFDINGRSLEQYFPRRRHQSVARQPLEAAGYLERISVRARIHGGGVSGQADAIRHGIAKALIEADPNLRAELKRRQFLTRDPRVKERRKAGLKKARKRPQFSKR